MKTLLKFAMMALIIVSCARKEKEFHIEGYLIADCENRHPLGNVKLSINQEGDGELATTTTDSWGYFSLTGTYRERTAMNGLELNIAAERTFSKIGLAYFLPSTVNLDTVFRSSLVWSILRLESLEHLEQEDTLFISYIDLTGRFGPVGNKVTRAFTGVFTQGMVFDTILSETSNHPKYPANYYPAVHVFTKNDGKTTLSFAAYYGRSTPNNPVPNTAFQIKDKGCGSYNEIPIRLQKL